MRRSLRSVALLVGVSLPAATVAQTPAPGVISIGRADSVWSPTLKEWRRYSVYTPPGYVTSVYLKRAYPVLYVLDGPAHFHSLSALVQFLATGVNGTFVFPEMIVVNIGNTDRTRDLTPSHSMVGTDGKPVPIFATSGGGDCFLKFVQSELIPRIDSAYRTEPYRIFIGHSFGGITVVQALYTMPEVFNAYVAIDPSMWWDGRQLNRKAADFVRSARASRRTLFVAQANTIDLASTDPRGPCIGRTKPAECADTTKTEHFRSITDFNRILHSSNTSGMRYAFKYYPEEDHGSVPMIAEYDALRFVFAGYKLQIAKKTTPAVVTAHYAALSERMGYTVTPPEKLLEVMGQAGMGLDTTWAVSILRYKTSLYPKSPHAFASLGTALLGMRDTTGAQSAYQQSLVLNPDNQAVKDLLAKLGR